MPQSKRETRLERMEKTRQQLESYPHVQLNQPSQIRQTIPVNYQKALWDQPMLSTRRQVLPPPAFLVAAAIESLQSSAWAAKVHVVPEEADSACARAMSGAGMSVLTNDSDLALYPFHEDNRIVWLHSVTKTMPKNPTFSYLRGSILQPSRMCERIGMSNLLTLAFERHLDITVGTATIVARAKARCTTLGLDPAYDDFQSQYRITAHERLSRDLKGLDPRTAELVVQMKEQQETAHVYLPILHEDSTRDAAWSYGSKIRQLAYSMLASSPSHSTKHVQEFYRKGQRVAPADFRILTAPELETAASETVPAFATLRNSSSLSLTILQWWLMAITLLIKEKIALGKAATAAMVYAAMGISPYHTRAISLDDVHFHANVQAVLYSMRMLKQILDHLSSTAPMGLSPTLWDLHQALEQLPHLQDLFLDDIQVRAIVRKTDVSAVNEMIDPMLALLDIETEERADEREGQGSKSRKHRKKRKRKSHMPNAQGGASETQNSFALLDDLT
jgi:hypothetical protein